MATRLRLKRKLSAPTSGQVRGRLIQRKLNDAASPFMDMVSTEKSLQLADPFEAMYGDLGEVTGSPQIVEPIYDPGRLITLGMQNSTLNQCIDAYVVNIESYGYQLEYIGQPGKEQSREAQAQKNVALAFLDSPNGDTSLREVRERSRKDMEYTGNRYFEIGRNLAGQVVSIDHVSGPSMRMTRKDRTPTQYTVLVPSPDGKGFIERTFSKHFRRFVQIGSNGQRVFFKEFNDPRSIDPTNGRVNDDLAVEDQATEIYHQALYFPGTSYGVPRWIGAMLMMLGAREAELVNLNYFRENAIPAMAVLISGGALTSESFDTVTNIINAARGQEAMQRILILEAASDESAGGMDEKATAPRIEMKPLGETRQNDGQFKEYRGDAKSAIRGSMRLPALYTGDTDEYTKATADAGQRVAENQVFGPERTMFDDFINGRVLPTLGVDQWQFKTMGPTIYDPESLSAMIDRFARHGALTPNILIKLANQVFDVQVPSVLDEWGDVPFVYTMAAVNAGHGVEGLEDILSRINDESNPALNPQDGGEEDEGDETAPTGANDNERVAARRLKRMIKRELHSVTTDLITRINDALEAAHYREAA